MGGEPALLREVTAPMLVLMRRVTGKPALLRQELVPMTGEPALGPASELSQHAVKLCIGLVKVFNV